MPPAKLLPYTWAAMPVRSWLPWPPAGWTAWKASADRPRGTRQSRKPGRWSAPSPHSGVLWPRITSCPLVRRGSSARPVRQPWQRYRQMAAPFSGLPTGYPRMPSSTASNTWEDHGFYNLLYIDWLLSIVFSCFIPQPIVRWNQTSTPSASKGPRRVRVDAIVHTSRKASWASGS